MTYDNDRITEYIVVLMLLTIPFYIINGLTQNLPKILPMGLSLGSLAIICPFITAIILVRKDEHLEGVKSLVKSSLDPRKFKKKWILPDLLIMPGILVGSYFLLTLQGIKLPQVEFSFVSVVILFVLFFIAAFFEEIGWMGFLYVKLEGKYNAFESGLLIGLLWAFWHIILFIQNGHSLIWVVWQCLFCISARVLMVWIYNNTNKSVLSAIIFHTMINVSVTLFPINGSLYDPLTVGLLTTMLVFIVLVLYEHKTITVNRFRNPVVKA